MVSSEQSFKCTPVLLGGCAVPCGQCKSCGRSEGPWGPSPGATRSVFGFGLQRAVSFSKFCAGAPPPLALPTSGHRLDRWVHASTRQLCPRRSGRAGPPAATRAPPPLPPPPEGPAARAGVAGTSRPRRPGHQQLQPSWAAPWVKPGGFGSSWPLPSSGGWGRGARDLALVRAAAVPSLRKRGQESLTSAVDSPCNIHYSDDCVFSLITHYFYAERGFLTKGKTTAITFILGAANSRNTLLSVPN